MQLYQATWKAQELFGIDLSQEDSELRQILNLGSKETEADQQEENIKEEHNVSMTSDISSTTLDRSFNSTPPLNKKIFPNKRFLGKKETSLDTDSKRIQCMYRKKRKVICKRKL